VKRSAVVAQFLELFTGDRRLTYVDCGARKGKSPGPFRRLAESSYVGIEADAQECARLNADARPGHRYLAAVLGARSENRVFRVTRNPASASMLLPNRELLEQFHELAESAFVEREVHVSTITLDECLARNAVGRVDFLELDVQGTELEILEHAPRTLASVVGIQVEVEFAPMYVDQPLFSDVDAFMRGRGFHLFDLSRYHVRRTALPADVPTRGQLLWGHALYLRNATELAVDTQARLAVVAALLDINELSAQLFGLVLAAAKSEEHREAARRARTSLLDRDVDPRLESSRGRNVWRD
jgi:FkbM family methyltransferase